MMCCGVLGSGSKGQGSHGWFRSGGASYGGLCLGSQGEVSLDMLGLG